MMGVRAFVKEVLGVADEILCYEGEVVMIARVSDISKWCPPRSGSDMLSAGSGHNAQYNIGSE